MFRKRPLRTFDVTLHLDGRHPYLRETDLDHETRDVTVRIAARDWNDAERTALLVGDLPEHWRRSVRGVAAV